MNQTIPPIQTKTPKGNREPTLTCSLPPMNAAVFRETSGVGNGSDDCEDDGEESSNVYDGEVETTDPITKTKKELKGFFTSLLLMEEAHDKHDQESSDLDSRRQMLDFQSNYRKRARTMSDYYSHLQDYYTDADETSRITRNKSRSVAAASAAVVAGSDQENSNPGSDPGQGQQRRLWVKDRSGAWWEECSHEDYPEEDFKRAFRMSRSTFEAICEELNSAVAKEDTALRNAIPVRQRVAACIWRLATGEPLRLVSKKFGLGISTCHKIVLEVCKAIKDVLMPKYLQWPDDEALRNITEEFESISGVPNIVGSMYTTHVPIVAPKISVSMYFNKRHTERNQKTSYSITIQAVVNPKGVFTDLCIGWPGSMPDDQVLEKSLLYQRASNGGLLNGMWVVGGKGHPLLDWVLVPYTQKNLTWAQHAFNENIGTVQWVAKEAFGRLKGRWACLQKRTEVKLQDLPTVLGACCVLHNICEIKGENLDPGLVAQVMDDEVVPENALRSVHAVKARDTIAHNLLHHGRAGTSFL
ncbi:PREDICTED: putative nuclease HARBI1 [Tarenaya hassleriana]|uniref:putative nuclease HARBI1 n=1 Tax=Tarenaya hassleriana TaxID=28532 RepID=UPI00053C764C|nr:PREDICTED: putative nuclease HARBI1 [Tarenaya hassleriana]